MTHATLPPPDGFSQELLRLIVPTGADGQSLSPAQRHAHRQTACLALPSRPLPGTIEAICAQQVAASHVAVMECFRRAMLHDVSAGTRARLGLRAAALMRQCATTLRQRDRAQAKATAQPRKIVSVLPHARWDTIRDGAATRAAAGRGNGVLCTAGHDPEPPHRQRPEPAVRQEMTRSYSMSGEKTGPLRNGNPRRDLRTLPRCGARTRSATACRQPAMRNGRCRLHGGKSTGARTEAGRAAQVAAQVVSQGVV